MTRSAGVRSEQDPVALPRWEAQERHRAVADVAELAVAAVPGCTAAALMLAADGGVSTVAVTGRAARAVDVAQHRYGAGPCLTAVHTGAVVLCEDYAAEHRWPAVTREAAAVGVRGSLSVPLVDGGQVLGALNLYASAAGAIDASSRRTVTALARQGVVALHLFQERRPEHPQRPAEPGTARARSVDALAVPPSAPTTGGGPATDPAELARHLALLLAGAEQDGRQLWRQLSDGPVARTASATSRSAWRCYSLIQDALLFGAIDLAANLDVPDHQLPL